MPLTYEEIKDDFRSIISHALLGSNTEDVDRETWELVFDECTKYLIKQARPLP